MNTENTAGKPPLHRPTPFRLTGIGLVFFLVVAVVSLLVIGIDSIVSSGTMGELAFVFTLLGASIIATSLIAWPELLLSTYLVAMSVWTFVPGQLTARLSGYLTPLTVVLACLALFVHYGLPKEIYIGKIGFFIILFSIYFVFSLMWTTAPQNGLFKATSFLLGSTVLYFLVRWIYRENPANLWRFIAATAVLGLIPVAVTIWASMRVGFASAKLLSRARMIRAESSFQVYGMSNGLQFAMVCAAALWLKSRNPVRRWFWLALTGVEFWALIALSQRAQLLGALLACGILIAARSGFRTSRVSIRRRVNLKSLILAGILLVFLLFLAFSYSLKLDFDYMASDANIHGRFNLYRTSFLGFLQEPILGHGLGSFSFDTFGIDARISSHNLVFEILYELGLVGLFLFAILILGVINCGRYLMKNTGLLNGLGVLGLSMIFARLFVAMFSANLSSLHLGPWLAMVVLAVSIGTKQEAKSIDLVAHSDQCASRCLDG